MELRGPHLNIAIDGPAGVGKTSIGLTLATDLGACFIDTGIMYRAIAYLVLRHDVPIEDEYKISQLAATTTFTLASDEQGIESTLLVNRTPITDLLHTDEVNSIVSKVAMIHDVRTPLVAWQRSIAKERLTVMVGRDITTVVLPEAQIKIYLDASLAERNRRRSLQNSTPNSDPSAVQRRDELDSTRTASPLYIGENVMHVDTSNLTFDQVYKIILTAVNTANL